MKIIGLGGFANVGKTTILKKLINDLKTSGLDLKTCAKDPCSPGNDLHVTFENKNKNDTIFIATGGDKPAHIFRNISEAKKMNATILVTPFRANDNNYVQPIVNEDIYADLIYKPKFQRFVKGTSGGYTNAQIDGFNNDYVLKLKSKIV